MTKAQDLVAHLVTLDIGAYVTHAGNVSVTEPEKLLAHLTDENFITRSVSSAGNVRSILPVQDKTTNPVGSLHEWAAQNGKTLNITEVSNSPVYEHGPFFAFKVECDDIVEICAEPIKKMAKRAACQAILDALAMKYGTEKV